MQEYTPSIGPEEARRIHLAYTLAREAFGDEIGIDVHCHCELDVPSAIKVAQAVEHINPLFFEDPLAPEWSESWIALRRTMRIPIMTGENMELAEWAIPFLQNQAVDIFQPDIINSGVKNDCGPGGAVPYPDCAAQRQRSDIEYGIAAVGGGGLQLPAHRVRGRSRSFPMGNEEPDRHQERLHEGLD